MTVNGVGCPDRELFPCCSAAARPLGSAESCVGIGLPSLDHEWGATKVNATTVLEEKWLGTVASSVTPKTNPAQLGSFPWSKLP